MGRTYSGNRDSRSYVFMPGQGFVPDVRQNRAIAEQVHEKLPSGYHNSANWMGLSVCPLCGMKFQKRLFKEGGLY